MTRVALVTGSREWTDAQAVFNALQAYGPDLVVHGGARGVDTFADEWAVEHGVARFICEPEYSVFSERAAPKARNRQIAAYGRGRQDAGDEVVCFAFPLKGGGTWDMIRCCERNGIEVRRHG